MKLICPECKNDVDLSAYGGEVRQGQTVECDKCGISLVITDVFDNGVAAEVADEGK